MTSRERVKKAFAHEKQDRVPVNYLFNETVHRRLAQSVGLNPDSYEVHDYLGVDFRELILDYTGPQLFQSQPERKIDPLWGIRTRWVPNESGGYWDYCDFPLAQMDEELAASWPVPNPDDFDYEKAREFCKQMADYAIHFGNPGLGDIMNSCGMLMGVENMLIALISEDEALQIYMNRRLAAQRGMLERVLECCGEYIEFIWTGEDLGTQNAPLISLELFRQEILPRHKQITDTAAHYGKPVLMHSCGYASWAFEDLISIGVGAMDTLQPEIDKMQPQYLMDHFGERLAFHGCISTAGPLAYGTVEAVRQNVMETLQIMKQHYGYCLAPTHLIQDNTPVENIIAMYETAHKYGSYR